MRKITVILVLLSHFSFGLVTFVPDYDTEMEALKASLTPPTLDSSYFSRLNSIIERSIYQYREFDTAVYYIHIMEKHALENGLKDMLYVCKLRRSNYFDQLNQDIEEIESLKGALKIAVEVNDTGEITRCNVKLGTAHTEFGMHEEGMNHYDRARKLALLTKDSTKLAAIYNNISVLYGDLEDFEKHEMYLLLAYNTFGKLGLKEKQFPSALNLAGLYSEQDKLDLAEKYFNECRNMINIETDIFFYTFWRLKKAVHLKKIGKETEAEVLLLPLTDEKKSTFFQGASQLTLSQIYFDQKKYRKAQKFGENALEKFASINYLLDQIDCAKILIDVYKKRNLVHETVKMQDLYMTLKDSLQKKENETKLLQQRLNFDYKTQEQAFELLQTQNELNLTKLQAQKFKDTYWFAGTFSLLIFTFLLFIRFRDKKKSNQELIIQNKLIQNQKEFIEKEKFRTTESLQCAMEIQKTILAPDNELKELFNSYFLLYKPKDIVSGDFCWHFDAGHADIVAVVDCTGHGVPGALTSMLGYSLLEKVVKEFGVIRPDLILNLLSREIARTKANNQSEYQLDIGMEVSICAINKSRNKMQYSSTSTAGILIRNNEIIELDRDILVLGRMDYKKGDSFNMIELNLNKKDRIYLYTDGFIDQKGGVKKKKYYTHKFKDFLMGIQNEPFSKQQDLLAGEFENWKGDFIQMDDVTVMGIEI